MSKNIWSNTFFFSKKKFKIIFNNHCQTGPTILFFFYFLGQFFWVNMKLESLNQKDLLLEGSAQAQVQPSIFFSFEVSQKLKEFWTQKNVSLKKGVLTPKKRFFFLSNGQKKSLFFVAHLHSIYFNFK